MGFYRGGVFDSGTDVDASVTAVGIAVGDGATSIHSGAFIGSATGGAGGPLTGDIAVMSAGARAETISTNMDAAVETAMGT